MFTGNFKVVQTRISSITFHDGSAFAFIDSVSEDLFTSSGASESQPANNAIDSDDGLNAFHGLVHHIVQSSHLSGIESVSVNAIHRNANRTEV